MDLSFYYDMAVLDLKLGPLKLDSPWTQHTTTHCELGSFDKQKLESVTVEICNWQ